MSELTHAARAAAPAPRRTPVLAYLAADWRRMRRTWLLPLTLMGPLGVTLMGVILFLMAGEPRLKGFRAGDLTGWEVVTGELGMVQVLALGLGAALLASMIVDVEHRSDTWKQMLGLPVSRGMVYGVKFAWAAALLAVSSVLMAVGYVALMVWLHLGPLPWAALATIAVLPWVATLPVLAFQLLLSTSMRNQALPLAVGVLTPIFGMGMSTMAAWMPWRLITQAMTVAVGGVVAGGPGESLTWLTPGVIVGLSVAWVVVLVSAGAVLLARREVR